MCNYNLYRLGRRKNLAERMISTKFEPYENWLPPAYVVNEEKRRGPVPKVLIVSPKLKKSSEEEGEAGNGNLFSFSFLVI